MKLYKIESKQEVPISLEKCWAFFSDPNNLKEITPDGMGFAIIDGKPDQMYPGQIIQYFVKPVLGIKLRWVTEITQVKDHAFFIDEQRFGPYKFWHHKHFFKATENGVEMIDIVHYGLPFGFLGRIANTLFVKHKLKQIFAYRHKKVEELFG